MPDQYPAKLLLFGEYTVLNGSQALSIPLSKWSGKWAKNDESRQMSLIPDYYNWLSKVELADDQTYERLKQEFEEGWFFDSTVPIGYGLGSSGSYVAGVYARYFHKPDYDFEKTSDMLAQMEAYFHGSSSGMDPLVSYSGKAVYKDDKGKFQLIDDKGWPEGFTMYLIDSGTTRETASLVNRYKERNDDHAITRKIKRQLIPLVDHAIHFYMNGEKNKLEECISTISEFQREHFEEVIPEDVKTKWDALTAQKGTYVKLCGAGGGGYFLVICTGQGNSPQVENLIRL